MKNLATLKYCVFKISQIGTFLYEKELPMDIFLPMFISQSSLKWSWKKKSFHVVPGPVQEVLPVRSQDLVRVPENVRDLVGRNQGE